MRHLLPALTAFSLLLLLPLAFSVQAAPARMALVIGNSEYEYAPLRNAVNDAALMTRTLKGVGFEVMNYENLDRRELKRAFLRFGDRVKNAGNDTVSLVYYAGHGAQVNGENYLIPIGSLIEDERDVDIEAIRASSLLRTLGEANAALNIVILDACRNNPFKSSSRSAQRGLAKMDAPTGTLLAYSTAPGQVSEDGAGSNSTYTKALSLAMRRPGVTVEQVFKRARIEVMTRTLDEQVPWESSSLTGDFYFVEEASNLEEQVGSKPAIESTPQVNLEAMFWQSIQGSEDAGDYEAYLKQYPEGSFAALAQFKVKKLGDTDVAVATPSAEPQPATLPMKLVPSTSFDGKWAGKMTERTCADPLSIRITFKITGTKVSGKAEASRPATGWYYHWPLSGSIDGTGKLEARAFGGGYRFSLVGTAKNSVISGKWIANTGINNSPDGTDCEGKFTTSLSAGAGELTSTTDG